MRLALIAAATVAFTLSMAAAQAAPLAPLTPLGATAHPDVVLVAEGCGRGYHRGPMGGCRRNMSPEYPCFWRRGPMGRWHMICR